MIVVPDKTMKLKYSIIGAGSRILKELDTPQTVSSLWEKVRHSDEVGTFDKYVLILDFLYALGLIEFKEGLLKKVNKNDKEGQMR
ncbi:ABC-three component system middle component 6 [Archaeoglobus veneficus]|uniref:ArsR family transcriptional regulator n=1 Tax=Archaeoglobus veneficus (strain DSM 11195 / SNP6) TaxID=693661 RepID=F2KSC8_ARCVS|nr:ABC-three component system middle component 6 [Archaeoglobus veneficus]AEA46897.1 hypothetical protein Arcve_0883 [Archaeoglobus veneficus SNP6]